MAKTINITIPHELGQAEAEQRIRSGLTSFKTSFGSVAKIEREQWNGGVYDFAMEAMRQQCQGTVTVLERSVQMELTLPTLLAMAAEKIRDAVTRKGTVLLEDKRDKRG